MRRLIFRLEYLIRPICQLRNDSDNRQKIRASFCSVFYNLSHAAVCYVCRTHRESTNSIGLFVFEQLPNRCTKLEWNKYTFFHSDLLYRCALAREFFGNESIRCYRQVSHQWCSRYWSRDVAQADIGEMARSLPDRVAGAYYAHGLLLSSHPIAAISLAISVLLLCWLVTLRLLDIVHNSSLWAWVVIESITVLQLSPRQFTHARQCPEDRDKPHCYTSQWHGNFSIVHSASSAQSRSDAMGRRADPDGCFQRTSLWGVQPLGDHTELSTPRYVSRALLWLIWASLST